ncbi:MAG TPA: HAD hydrolase family protein [Gammaproteobacteria bacterium]|nr:HAD hydrolase family protein [Gammaproteobacteria bacterium]
MNRERLAAVRLLALDVDGVLTDGRVWFFDDGHEAKAFSIRDGHGIKRLLAAGVAVIIISGRRSAASAHRAQELGITAIHEGVSDKAGVLAEAAATAGVALADCAFMGDDEPDMPALEAAGIALAPADAIPAVRALADWCATSAGGRGAVREACELLLAARQSA